MEKPVFWIGDSYENLIDMPEDVQDEFGYAIGAAQLGGKASSANPMKGNLRDVMEVVDDEDGDTYRAMYTVTFAKRVYVLDCFKKKSTKGIATPKHDLDRIKQRLKAARKHYKENPP